VAAAADVGSDQLSGKESGFYSWIKRSFSASSNWFFSSLLFGSSLVVEKEKEEPLFPRIAFLALPFSLLLLYPEKAPC